MLITSNANIVNNLQFWEQILSINSSRMSTQYDKKRVPIIVAKRSTINTGIISKSPNFRLIEH